jgi:hypothetical protein
VQQGMDPAAGSPPPDAAVDGGNFFGIPYGWPLAAVIVGVILFMWMARHPVRQVLWQVFFITGRVFGRWGVWLKEHGQAARQTCNDKIASQRADELQDRLLVLEGRMGHRAAKLAKETTPIIAKLDKSTHALSTAATGLSDINLEDAAERAFRAAMPSIEQGRGLSKMEKTIAQNTGAAMNERLAIVRPALKAIEVHAPRLQKEADKLTKIDQRFNQNAEEVNRAFTEFEKAMHSEGRAEVAAKASILVPWLIALLVTGIALSGVFLNFFLIERPMAEIVGDGARIAGIGLPVFAALIVIFLEFVAGVVLMDAAGFTRLIPTFDSMSDTGRKIMFWVAFGFLVAFSVLEVSLAIVREQIIEQEQLTRSLAVASLSAPEVAAAAPGAEGVAPVSSEEARAAQGLQLITLAQMLLAAIIPWLLATAALPLETIVRNSVFILSIFSSYAMIGLAFIFKTISVALKSAGMFVLSVYDLIIFVPLGIQRAFRPKRNDDGGKETRRSQDRRERKERKQEEVASEEEDDLMLSQPLSRRERRERERELKRA